MADGSDGNGDVVTGRRARMKRSGRKAWWSGAFETTAAFYDVCRSPHSVSQRLGEREGKRRRVRGRVALRFAETDRSGLKLLSKIGATDRLSVGGVKSS